MIAIKKASPKHVPEIVELWKEFMDFHKKIDPIFTRKKGGHKEFEKYVKKLMASENSEVFVALDQENVVGYALAIITRYPPVFKKTTYGMTSDFAVKKAYRRKGIGEKMLAKVKKWFSIKGITRIELRLVSKNKVACLFWEKHGFKEYVRVMYRA